jgi:hypothetical protein
MKPSIFNSGVKCFDMMKKKKLLQSSQAMLMMILAGIAVISASSFSIDEAMAFPHASLIIDPQEEHANSITIVLGHTNEPAYGKLPGIHDGKHNLEVDISDTNTTLPIPEANITADKYYFKNRESFKAAESLDDADAIQKNVPVTAVFGQAGTFYNRQVIDPGIYGYTIRGVINYFDVALVPFEATKFCSIPGENLTKFDTPDTWTGSYGCPQNIKSIFFPPANNKYPDNNYPPQYPKYDDGYGIYEQQQQQQQQYNDNNNNDYGYVNEDYKQDNNRNNYDETRDDGRDDKKDDDKRYDKNNNYEDQYKYEYTDDNGEYGNEYASYDEE